MSDPTNDNAADPTPQSTASITSGTASEAMMKAAMAASSADQPAGAGAEIPSSLAKTIAGDTSAAGGAGKPAATPDATSQPKPTEPAAPPAATARADTPEPRIVAAVRNAREGVLKSLGITAEQTKDVPAAVSLLTDLRKDTLGFTQQLADEQGYVLVKKGEARPAASTDERLKPSLRSPDGSKEAYDAKEVLQLLEQQERRLTQMFEQRLNPLEQSRKTEAERARQANIVAETTRTKDAVLTKARVLPHFKEHETEIAERLLAMDPDERMSIGTVAALYQCYNDILNEKVFPGIETSALTAAEKKVREGFAKSARSSGSIAPGGQGGDGKAPVLENPDQLAAHMRRLAEQQTA